MAIHSQNNYNVKNVVNVDINNPSGNINTENFLNQLKDLEKIFSHIHKSDDANLAKELQIEAILSEILELMRKNSFDKHLIGKHKLKLQDILNSSVVAGSLMSHVADAITILNKLPI